MKRLLMILAVLTALCLFGCGSDDPAPEETGTDAETSASETDAETQIAGTEEETTGEVTEKMNITAVSATGTDGMYFRRWFFGGDAGANGFETDGGKLTVGQELLTYGQTGNSVLISPLDTAIPTDSVRTFELRLRTSDADKLKLEWTISGRSGRGSAEIPLINDGQWHDYQIDLALNEGWDGIADRFFFSLPDGKTADFSYIALSGIYVVPFPWVGGDLESDAAKLEQIKQAYGSRYGTNTVGFSMIIQYLDATDAEDNLALSGMRSVEYIVELAKKADMPVMIWLRADPWGDVNRGVAKKLYDDPNSLMWTQSLEDPVFLRNETGYRYYTLAQNGIDGQKTKYWQYTEKLLADAAEQVARAIEENPGLILGVTTTSEYKYNTDIDGKVLDYNPATILEFRDYCKEKYKDIETLNAECKTEFTSWELRSTDTDPKTEENPGGFDAPRNTYKPDEFWKVWTEFRAVQIQRAVQKLVDIIGQKLDPKYIYTHQICSNKYSIASPITCGDADNSNVGIDFFNSDCTQSNLQKIVDMLNGDASRTWGVPEWLALHDSTYKQTNTAVSRMVKYGIKYITPFNWGSGDSYDFRDSESEKVMSDLADGFDRQYDPILGSTVRATSGFTNGGSLVDGNTADAFRSESFKAGDWISFEFASTENIHTLTLIGGDAGGMPVSVRVQYLRSGEWVEIGGVSLENVSGSAVIVFDSVETEGLKLIIDVPGTDADGASYFSLAEIMAR